MATTQTELADAPVTGLASGVQGAASAFLSAWSGYAGESAAICEGMGEALRLLVHDVTATDEQRQAAFSRLDGRLGPQR